MRYLFKHALVHDAAYRMLVHTHRQSLHTQAVEALESVYSPDLRPHFGELAFHSEKAGLADKAIYYLCLAGDAARDAYQNNPAVDFYSRALKLMPMQDLEGRYTLLLSREAVYNLLGDREAQLTDLAALEMLAAALDAQVKGARQAEVGERWAGYANQVGDYEGAAGRAEKAVALARDAGDMEVTLRAHLTWSFALWRIGKYESAIQQAEAGLESARQIDNKREQSRALNTLGLIAMEQRGSIDARQYFEAALHIAQEAGDRQIEAAALNNLGNFAGASGDFIEAADYYQRAIQVTREIGQRPGEGRGLGNLGWIVGTLGDYTAARSYCEQNLRIAREAGDRHTEAYALVNLSAFSASQGEHATAQAYAERSLSLARETHDPSCEAWALTYLGNALLASGHVRASRGVYEGALNIRRSLGQPNLAAEPLAGLARSLLANGDLPTALRHVQEILTHLEGGGSLDGTDEPLRVYLTIYTVFHTASDPRAQHVLEEAFHILEGRAAKIKDATLRRTFIENVPYHREILAAWKATLD
jgi:tetratricopeptide (TPR) repeat protein